MMWTRTTAVASATALAAGLVVVAAGEASAARTVTIKVTEIQAGFTATFEGRAPRVGDSFVFTGTLRQAGEKVGTDRAKCTFKSIEGTSKSPRAGVTRCKATFKLPRGDIQAAGRMGIDFTAAEPEDFTLRLTGGTRRYEGATGTFKNHQVNDRKAKLTLTVTTP